MAISSSRSRGKKKPCYCVRFGRYTVKCVRGKNAAKATARRLRREGVTQVKVVRTKCRRDDVKSY